MLFCINPLRSPAPLLVDGGSVSSAKTRMHQVSTAQTSDKDEREVLRLSTLGTCRVAKI